MEKTSGSNDGPNSFQQHGAPTRTARAGSRCAHQSAGTFDDTAAETRVPPSLDVRVRACSTTTCVAVVSRRTGTWQSGASWHRLAWIRSRR